MHGGSISFAAFIMLLPKCALYYMGLPNVPPSHSTIVIIKCLKAKDGTVCSCQQGQ